MIWLIFFVVTILGYSSFIFIRKVKLHRYRCEHTRASLYLPIENKKADYSCFFPASLAVGEYLWQVYTIDSNVIKAIDFSSQEELTSALDVSNYLMLNMFEKDETSFLGFRNRLIGYIGEQKVSDLLDRQSHEIVWASTSNQELWDLKIDDNLVNVKTILDIDSIKMKALAHPDVTYLVPEDTYQNIGIDNIQPLENFNYREITTQFDSTIEHANGSAASDSFDIHLPIGAGIAAIYERQRLLRAGGDKNSVNKNVLIDFSSKTVCSLTMAKVGTSVGLGLGSLVFLPVVGGIVGAGVGALIGSKMGANFGKKIKELEFQKEKLRLEQMLDKFGFQYLPYIKKLKYQASVPLKKQQQSLQLIEQKYSQHLPPQKWKYYFFPDLNYIFYDELKKIAETNLDKSTAQFKNIENTLIAIENEKNSKALAILVLNNIYLRDLLYIDLIQIKKIYDQKRKVYIERYKLYPDKFPLNPDIINHNKLYS
ncbi:oxidoreductase [Acinetobacter sp. ACNIH2]|uniref:oxidoreductase n=1 Tax=Acinetobacter sp. ACNIH2 TaxID=1758189 RepID=UPI000CDC2FA3|nr:oxidoreductase [Acinetobacter sp. ACNIH2]AUX86459.1 oxidoreductase [Acinetobacter sp. ACNIH2]